MFAFNVWLNNKLIDTVWYSVGKRETIATAIDSTRQSLINHDGYSPEIRVTWPKGQRLTNTVYELQGNYGYRWELLTASENRREVIADKKAYLENAPCPLRIVRKLERKGV